MDADIVLTRELVHYGAVWVSLAATLLLILRRATAGAGSHRPQALGASSAAWFTPVYLWGITSVLHAEWWLTAGFRGIAPHPYFFTRHGTFSMAVGCLCVVACLLAERLGRGVGLPSRSPGASIPAPVVAALVSVAANWWLIVSLVFYPLPFLGGALSE